VPALITLGDATADEWLAGEAVRALGRSGDPRARRPLRAIVADASRGEELRVAAVTGLGGMQANGEDAALLRESMRGFTLERTRESVLTAVAAVGGKANAAWLLAVTRDETLAASTRRRAMLLAERAGASGADLAAAYDAADDTATREAAITALAAEGSRPAREKLGAIAKSTESPSLRRRAISALERFDSAETRELLTTLAMPRP
jgi:hypothetical protein